MKRLFFPLLLIALGVAGLVEHDAINNAWQGMFPQDPARQAALSRCSEDDRFFNRLSATARAACYQKYLQVELPVAAPPGITVQVPGAPPAHVVPHAPPVRTNH
jgi:hypothetical protein